MTDDKTVSRAGVDWARLAAQVTATSDPVLELRRHQVAQWGSGVCVPAEEYLARFPNLTDEDALVLIIGEVQLRRERGRTATADEYRQRFPALAGDLEVQFALLGELLGSTRELERGLSPTEAAPPSVRDPTTRLAVPGHDLAEEIGRGGMGVVYRARDRALDRDVAVKILQTRYAPDGTAAHRFVDEARITGQLQHPGVPPIYQVGTLPDGRPYLAMKLIKGQTLADLLAGPATDRGRLVAAFEQVCQTVGFAHAHEVIHRDLKPANVMVGKYGEVQVMDWGLAKVLTGSGATAGSAPPLATGTEIRSQREPDSGTLAGDVLGTPAFMPPEQAGGEIEKIDRRSDVFGLGAVLCSILTGAPPYSGRTVEAVKLMAVRGQLGDAHARLDNCGAEPDLVSLTKRCLAVEPGDRPEDANEVAMAVGAVRNAAEERARQAELDLVRAEGERRAAELRAAEARKRRRAQAAFGVAVGAVLGLIAFGAWWQSRVRAERDMAAEKAEIERERERLREREEARQAAAGSVADGAIRLAYRLLDKWWVSEADEVLRSAETAIGGDAPAAVRDRLRVARRDVEFVTRMDALRAGHKLTDESGAVSFSTFAGKAYPALFAEFGFDLQKSVGPESDVISRMRLSPVRKHILATLDTWMFNEPDRLTRAGIWMYTTPIGTEPWRVKLATDWRSPGAVLNLITDAKPEDRTPALYDFVGNRVSELKGDGSSVFRDGIARHPTDPWLRYSGGGHFYRTRQYANALAEFRTLTALRPTFAGGWKMLAASMTAGGDPAGAKVAALKSLELDDRDWETHLILGHALEGLRDPEGAASRFRRSAELAGPGYFSPHANLGRTEYLAGHFSAAVAAYRTAETSFHKAFPTKTYLNIDYGLALFAVGEWADSERVLRAAAAANPKLAILQFHVGLLCRRRGDTAAAGEYFRQGNGGVAVAAANQDWEYCKTLRSPGSWNFDLVVRVWAAACQHAQNDPAMLHSLGVLYRWAHRPTESFQTLRRADELSRANPAWPYPTAELLSASASFIGEYDVALEAGTRAAASEVSRSSSDLYYYLGTVYWAKGNFERSEEAVQKSIKLCGVPPSAVMLCDLGMALRRRGGAVEAAEHFRRACGVPTALAPEQVDDRYAQFYLDHGIQSANMVIARFVSASQSAPDDPYLHLTLGALYRRTNRPTEAAKAFATADDLAKRKKLAWPYPAGAWAEAERKKVAP